MDKVRGAIATLVSLIRGGAFNGHHRPVRHDYHTLAAAGVLEVYPLHGGYGDHAWMQQEPPDAHLEDAYDSRCEADDEYPF